MRFRVDSKEPLHSDTLAASKLTASFLCLLLEAEPGVFPLEGAFCLGGVCWDVVIGVAVVGVAPTGSGLDEEVLGLQLCWSAWSTLGEY